MKKYILLTILSFFCIILYGQSVKIMLVTGGHSYDTLSFSMHQPLFIFNLDMAPVPSILLYIENYSFRQSIIWRVYNDYFLKFLSK